jgi:hypothetical protein
MLRTKLAAAAAHWNRRNQWDGDGAYGCDAEAVFAGYQNVAAVDMARKAKCTAPSLLEAPFCE